MIVANANLSNEAKILFLCSRINLSETQQGLLKDLIQKDINWQKVVKDADRHRTICLLYKNLSQLHLNNKEIIDICQGRYLYFLLKTSKMYEKLCLILNDLRQKNIKIILLKGIVLAKLLYKDIALRPMADIDMLVCPKDWRQIDDVLKNRGFTARYDLLKLNNLSKNRLYFHILYSNRTKNQHGDVDYNDSVHIEPRFKIFEFDFYKVNTDKIWNAAIEFSCDGINALMLSYEDMIMQLCFNLSKYNFGSLRSICDINEFILKYKDIINWDVFIKKSHKRYLNPINYFGLKHIKKLFDTPIPENVLQDLKPNKNKIILLNNLFPNINSAEVSLQDHSSILPFELRFLLITYRLSNITMLSKILVFFLSTIFPSAKFLSYRYNIALSPFTIFSFYGKRLKKALHFLIKLIRYPVK